MRRTRRITLLILLALAIAVCWFWWDRPEEVDMAGYAPADSLFYLEANRPLDVIGAVAETDAWKTLQPVTGKSETRTERPWAQRFIAWTGIGPIQSVILARAQVAVVVTDLGTTEEGDALKIKPEGAILIETHTAERRVKPTFEWALQTLAEKTYSHATSKRVLVDGIEFIEWQTPERSRQIVGALVGSLAIVGTSERAVQSCLAVLQGRRPSLRDDRELTRMRGELGAAHALSFGYVPSGNSARLLAIGVPILMGRAPGDSEFQRLVSTGAGKVFASLAWVSRPYQTGIEDHYLIALQSPVIARLKPAFASTGISSQLTRLIPEEVYSVTSYKFENAGATWQSLRSAVSSQVDALSAVVFAALLKSALLSYGIDDPETFLAAVQGELLTLRLDESSAHSLLIATVRDRAAMMELVSKKMSTRSNRSLPNESVFEDAQGEFAASFVNDLMIIGTPTDVRRYVEALQANRTIMNSERLRQLTFFAPSLGTANVVTFTNDADRVRDFISTMISARGRSTMTTNRLEETIARLPYAATETTLGERGIERMTRSPLGQFSTFLPLLFPQRPTPSRNSPDSK